MVDNAHRLRRTAAAIVVCALGIVTAGCSDDDKTRNDGVQEDETGVTVTIDEIHR